MKRFFCTLAMMLVVLPSICCAENNTIEFRIVYDTACDGCQAMPYQQKANGKEETLFVGPVELSDMDIQNTEIRKDKRFDSLYLVLYFTEKARDKFADITGSNIGRRLAIIVKGEIITAPVVRERIGGGVAQITGNFTENEITDIQKQIMTKVYKRKSKYLGSGQGSH